MLRPPDLRRPFAPIRARLVDGARRVRSLFALARGRLRLRLRDVDGALASLTAATRDAPGAFAPWLHLARAHLRRRDLPLARAALARARVASPARFDRIAPRCLRRDGFEWWLSAEVAAEPAPLEGVPSVEAGASLLASHGARADAATLRAPARERVAAASLPLGDCRDLDEYARFRSMPPISLAERESVDWDAVADDLLDG